MVKTIFYIAGGTHNDMKRALPDCTILREEEGILWELDRNRDIWVKEKGQERSTERWVVTYSDLIDENGITRRIVLNCVK